jgi:UDP-N-acetylglucosamine--N-acetylmuramyl-(pentapeptide) pyrophosphoryl-undecaprenol N-acetylglucosamine transferase
VKLRALIAGGGTGGHVTPALALGEALRAAGDAVLFAGTARGLETRLVPEAGFELVTFEARPMVGRGPLARVGAALAILRGTWHARAALRRFAADVVIAVGGYASVPAALAAVTLRIPVALVNTDATAGRANRLLARFAARIFVGYASAAAALRRGPEDPRVIVSGVPLREALRRAFRQAAEAPAAAPDARLRLLVFGGSQGARQINDAMMKALAWLEPQALSVVHQTGEADRERVAAAYRAAGFEAEVLAFERDMPSRYRWADLVLCRAGAISVAELALAGRPALLVPLAHVGGGEQRANASQLERVGAARVLDAATLDPADLVQELRSLAADRARLEAMGRAAATLARPEAAAEIVAACREMVAARRAGRASP